MKEKVQEAIRNSFKPGAGLLSALRDRGKELHSSYMQDASMSHRRMLSSSAGRSIHSTLLDFGAGARGRARVAEGMQKIMGTKTRFGAAVRMESLMRANPEKLAQLKKLQKYAFQIATKGNRNIGRTAHTYESRARELLNGMNRGSRLDRMVAAPAKVAAAGWAERGLFKAAGNVIFNRRALGAYGIAMGSSYAVSRLNKWAESRYRTENVGRGRFGTDSAGLLGPASTEGVRFSSMKKRRMA